MKTFIISTFKLAIAVLIMLGTLVVQANAQEYGVNGLLMGAGSGTPVGQASGRDTEATLIGTAVGGMLGYMIGNEMDKDAYARSYGSAQPVTFFPSLATNKVFPHRYGKICHDFVVFERHQGHFREVVVKTVCRDRHLKSFRDDHRHHFRNDFRHDFRDDRHHFRSDHRKHWKGGNRHHRW